MSDDTYPGGIFQDGQAETCPDCGGELQYQTNEDVLCLDCGEDFAHYVSEHWDDSRTHRLVRAPGTETVAKTKVSDT